MATPILSSVGTSTTILSSLATDILILVSAAIGIVFALVQWIVSSKEHGGGEEERNINHNRSRISEGATSFLLRGYKYVGALVVAFAIVIFLLLGSVKQFSTSEKSCTQGSCKPALATAICSTISFLLGAITSLISGFYGMKIATSANAQTTLEARSSIGRGFIVAFRSGAAVGFLRVASGLLFLHIAINVLMFYYGYDWGGLFEAITGYGLGASFVALFSRVSGGIYAKAAAVGAAVGKIERNISEDHPSNPAVIADKVGDNVGDLAGMGSDIFGSYAESSCAALFFASISSFGVNHEFTAMLFPLIISSVGIIICLVTILFTTHLFEIRTVNQIKPALRTQLIISTVLMTFGVFFACSFALPSSFTIFNFGEQKEVKNWELFVCVVVGLWAGLIIGFVTEYHTNNAYGPVQEVVGSCNTGVATNVIFGLALGHKSVIIPSFAIAISSYVGFRRASMYGIALVALGMLSTKTTGLAIDAYGTISNNAGGIAKMAGMDHAIRERTDALDAAGNTTAAIGKGVSIGSAALVSLALFGAFASKAAISTVDELNPKVFIGQVVGSMLPYWFSAMTMKSIGRAALRMVDKVHTQFNNIEDANAAPDYVGCVNVCINASIKEMILPAVLVLLTPLAVGIIFGVETLAGVLGGSLASALSITISASNTGGAWDSAKRYIETGTAEQARSFGPEGSRAYQAAVIGDLLKDTSGPSLNILIKLMAMESLVFAPFFTAYGGLIFKI
ncbi:hypothetical protein K1719_011671 [Acacia pycnantha]|nr:hypothetical protein K1719_011671 [Acacia pycnantha]